MKQFLQKTEILKYETAKEFVEEFKVGTGDFILATKTIYKKYFEDIVEGAAVYFKSDYGTGEPTDIMLDALLDDFRKGEYDRIIAIGGGAVIDMAKILVLDTDAYTADIFQKKVEYKKGKELIAVPTTCGAGSEVSNVSIAELTKLGTKLGVAEDAIYADHAVLIPQLLEELPYEVFATSAIDALIHAIESYVSPKATVFTQMFSKEAIKTIIKGFKKVLKNGKDSRKDMMGDFLIASTMAGVAFGNAGTGAVHAMSYPLGGTYHVPHGEANYQFLTAVLEKYMELDPNGKINEVNACLSSALICAPEDVNEQLEALLDQIISRKPLKEYGMKESEIVEFAKSVYAGQQRLLNQSYVKFDEEIMEGIYRKLYS